MDADCRERLVRFRPKGRQTSQENLMYSSSIRNMSYRRPGLPLATPSQAATSWPVADNGVGEVAKATGVDM